MIMNVACSRLWSWDVASYSLVEINRRFGGAYCFYHQGGDDHDEGSMIVCRIKVLPSSETSVD